MALNLNIYSTEFAKCDVMQFEKLQQKNKYSKKERKENFTRFGSLMLPRPLIKTRHSVVASTRLREFPLGPRRRPTKLYCKNKNINKEMIKKIILSKKLLIKT